MGGLGAQLLTCPYPLKVQACQPRNQIPALRSRVSMVGEGKTFFVLTQGSLDVKQVLGRWEGGGGGAQLLTCPCTLKVQACPPR